MDLEQLTPGLGGLRAADHGALIEAGRDMRLIGRAISRGWNVPEHIRVKCLSACEAVLDLPTVLDLPGGVPWSPLRVHALKLLAVRTVALLDLVDVRRERNHVAERGQEIDVQTDALRELLATTAGRRALASLTELQPTQGAAVSPLADPAGDGRGGY
jgi:hypothetical protein